MAKKKTYVFLSSLAAALHFGVVFLYIASLFLLFLSEKLRLYAALFLALVWVQWELLRGCALTQLETYFLKKAGKKFGVVFFFNRFAHNFFKKIFNMPPSQVKILGRLMLFLVFVISVIIIILHFQ